jgi:ferritin-like metal-binding protein YciE
MKTKGFTDLFELELKDLYSAEKQLTKALPKMAKAATNEDLRQAFENHLEETEGQIERLETIFAQLDISYARVEKCKAMEGLIEEGNADKKLTEIAESVVNQEAEASGVGE